MGQLLSNITAYQDTSSKQDGQLANDALKSLTDLAEAQSDLFYSKITNSSFDAKMIPIDKVIQRDTIMRANVSKSGDNLTDGVKEIVGNFASKQWGDGIANLLSVSLKALFGSYSGNTSKTQSYVVSVGALGGIFRIDYFIYSYRFQSETLLKVASDILLIDVVVSSVDINTINDNTLITLVQKQFGDELIETQKSFLKEIREQLRELRSYEKSSFVERPTPIAFPLLKSVAPVIEKTRDEVSKVTRLMM